MNSLPSQNPSNARHWFDTIDYDKVLCKGMDDLFFPLVGDMKAVAEAKKVCAGCTEKDACLQLVLSLPPHTGGVWAGTTARERRRLRSENGSHSRSGNGSHSRQSGNGSQ